MKNKQETPNPADLVEVTNLFDRDLEELAKDAPAIDKIVDYLRLQRDNVKAAESTGKRITKKTATAKPAAKPFSLDSPLSGLNK